MPVLEHQLKTETNLQPRLEIIVKEERERIILFGHGILFCNGAKRLIAEIQNRLNSNEISECKEIIIDLSEIDMNSGKIERIVDFFQQYRTKSQGFSGKFIFKIRRDIWERYEASLIEYKIIPSTDKEKYNFNLDLIATIEPTGTKSSISILHSDSVIKRLRGDFKSELKEYRFRIIDVLRHSVKLNIEDADKKEHEMYFNRKLFSDKYLDVVGLEGIFFVLEKNDGNDLYSEIHEIKRPSVRESLKKAEMNELLKKAEDYSKLIEAVIDKDEDV